MRHLENVWNSLKHPSESEVVYMNNSFGYEIEAKDTISIHIENATKLRENFHELARLLKNSEKLRSVKLITATSWIVTEKPKLLERLGFRILQGTSKVINKYKNKYNEELSNLPEDVRKLYKPEVEPGYAQISKEEFLKLYE